VLQELGCPFLDKARYWALKRLREPEARILEACGAEAAQPKYTEHRRCRIEAREYLAQDTVQEGALLVLHALGRDHEQILVTLRNDRANLNWQLQRLDLLGYFSAVLSSGEITDPRWKMKWGLMAGHLKGRADGGARHVLITDTETDLESGKELGFWTVAVANGIRERSILAAAAPDLLLDRTSELLEVSLPWTDR
jgi:phosphoglycolate phosphatase-like HAD superfamily hydrolase